MRYAPEGGAVPRIRALEIKMEIKKTLLPPERLKPLFQDAKSLPFGRNFTDYMFTMQHRETGGWTNPEIKPYQPLVLDPAAAVLHYSQEVFEGQKGCKSAKGAILLFRPRENAQRMNLSLRRMCMPEIAEETFIEAECELLKLEERWIPDEKGTALYIRPTVIATEAALGVRPSGEYLFYIILSPVGYYFQGGFMPLGLWVCDDQSRSAPGGTGEAKTGGNYAASMLANRTAREKGYDQVLWLDSGKRQYIEELSAMNIFFVIGDKLVTPALSGSILRGITRKSILEMSADLGIAPEERRISIREIIAGIQSGNVREAFAVGTAAVVHPVGRIHYLGTDSVIGEKIGPWTQKIFDTLTGIQYGQIDDPYGWVYTVT